MNENIINLKFVWQLNAPISGGAYKPFSHLLH